MAKGFDFTYRPGKRGMAKILGDLEGQVMEVLWARGPQTVREVQEGFAKRGRELAYTTVMTVMSRLAEKGYLERTPEGNAFRYGPKLTREEFLARASREVFSGLAKDLSGPVLSAFVDGLSATEARALEALGNLVEEKRKRRGRGSRRP